jgi:hypothetical protein
MSGIFMGRSASQDAERRGVIVGVRWWKIGMKVIVDWRKAELLEDWWICRWRVGKTVIERICRC